jgi:secondary thiamine-phosphate synthase enzyme
VGLADRSTADRAGAGRPRSVKTRRITVRTGRERGFTDLTPVVAAFVQESAARAETGDDADGLLSVFVPHATAGVVILELGAGSDDDALDALDRLLPRDDRWRHRHGSAGHGADHVVPLLAAPSVTVPVIAGRLALGTWQSIALLDPNADNAERTVVLSFLAG